MIGGYCSIFLIAASSQPSSQDGPPIVTRAWISRQVWIGLLFGMLAAFGAAAAERNRVLINHAPPYRIAEGGPIGGLYVEIYRAAAARAGLPPPDFQAVPLARAFRMMEAGEGDVMLGPNRTAEREAYLIFLDEPLDAEPKALVIGAAAADIASYDQLRGLRVGVLRGANYFQPFDSDAAIGKEVLTAYEQGLRMVAGGRVDAVIVPERQAVWLLRAENLPLRLATFRAPGTPSHIVIARRSPLITRRAGLEAALRSLRQDGTLDAILARYR